MFASGQAGGARETTSSTIPVSQKIGPLVTALKAITVMKWQAQGSGGAPEISGDYTGGVFKFKTFIFGTTREYHVVLNTANGTNYEVNNTQYSTNDAPPDFKDMTQLKVNANLDGETGHTIEYTVDTTGKTLTLKRPTDTYGSQFFIKQTDFQDPRILPFLDVLAQIPEIDLPAKGGSMVQFGIKPTTDTTGKVRAELTYKAGADSGPVNTNLYDLVLTTDTSTKTDTLTGKADGGQNTYSIVADKSIGTLELKENDKTVFVLDAAKVPIKGSGTNTTIVLGLALIIAFVLYEQRILKF